MTTRDHRAHLAAGAALTLAGLVSAGRAAAAADRRGQLAHAATAAGLGWLAMRYAALSARVWRVERASGTWRTAEPGDVAPWGLSVAPAPVAGDAADVDQLAADDVARWLGPPAPRPAIARRRVGDMG